MKKDFVTITPDSGGGSATPQVTAEPNVTAQSRSTTLNFNAAGQQLKSVQVNQLAMPWFLNMSAYIASIAIGSGQTTKCNVQEAIFEPSVTTHLPVNTPPTPLFKYDVEVHNWVWTARTQFNFRFDLNLLASLVDANEVLYEWSYDGGEQWDSETAMWENTFEDYQWWWGTSNNIDTNQGKNKVVYLRIGVGNSPEIFTYIAQVEITIMY